MSTTRHSKKSYSRLPRSIANSGRPLRQQFPLLPTALTPPGVWLWSPEDENPYGAGNEAGDVRHEGHAASAGRARRRRDGAGIEQLHEEPEPEQQDRR